LNVIVQPWNIKHIIIKTSDKINLLNQNNTIIISPEILASITINKLNEKKISMIFNTIAIKNEEYTHKINNPEIYFKEDSNKNLQFVLKSKKLIYKPAFVNINTINNIEITGKLVNYKNIDINNYFNWFANEGGLDIENFNFNISQDLLNGNAFFGIDKNLDIQSSVSFQSENLSKVFKILKNNNYITENTFKTSNFIIKAIEIAANFSEKKPSYSISMQNGYLSLMGVKLINLPNLKILEEN